MNLIQLGKLNSVIYSWIPLIWMEGIEQDLRTAPVVDRAVKEIVMNIFCIKTKYYSHKVGDTKLPYVYLH